MCDAADEQLTWPVGQRVSDLTIAARSIGIDERALATELGRGQSIAQVARQNGVKPHRVVVALVSAVMADVAADTHRGDLTKRQIRWLVGFATLRAEAQVMSSHPELGFGPAPAASTRRGGPPPRPAACNGVGDPFDVTGRQLISASPEQAEVQAADKICGDIAERASEGAGRTCHWR